MASGEYGTKHTGYIIRYGQFSPEAPLERVDHGHDTLAAVFGFDPATARRLDRPVRRHVYRARSLATGRWQPGCWRGDPPGATTATGRQGRPVAVRNSWRYTTAFP